MPEKLVFTFAWEQGVSCGKAAQTQEHETLVTIEFRDPGQATEVVLMHEYFLDSQERDWHSQGWGGCLDRLAKVV